MTTHPAGGSQRAGDTAAREDTGATGSQPNLGAVFTRRWVVDLVLDLAGYTPDLDLGAMRLLEPSVGHGAFLGAVVERLVQSCADHGRPIGDCGPAVRGLDIDPTAVESSRAWVTATLRRAGVHASTAARLARTWVNQGDFLLSPAAQRTGFDWVVGNPPYIRVEDVAPPTNAAYRAAWASMNGRADIYVGFLEAGLDALTPQGRMAYICADRWMRNQYGAAIRTQIADQHSLDVCLVMHTVDAFEDPVAAYPAVTVIRKAPQGEVLVADANDTFDAAAAGRFLDVWRRGRATVESDTTFTASWSADWFGGPDSWPAGPPPVLARVRAYEQQLPTLAEAGVKVSVGTATGADDLYVTVPATGIEPDRLVKAVSAREVADGTIKWTGRSLVNPWKDGAVVALGDYPRAAAYWRRHARRLKARYVAKKSPHVWWRTIDKVDDETWRTPKLLIPDLKNRIFPVYDPGEYQPMHSLYYLTADRWDLEVLGGLLMSDTANMFVEAYSVRMASGYLRVSAQYLRRVRVPPPEGIDAVVRDALRRAFRDRDPVAAEASAAIAYRDAADAVPHLSPPPVTPLSGGPGAGSAQTHNDSAGRDALVWGDRGAVAL